MLDLNLPNLASCLLRAAKDADAAAIQHLIDAGTNVNAVDRRGDTPLHLAARNGGTKIAQALITAGANIGTINRGGEPPIVTAFEYDYHDTVRLLQAHGAVLPENLRERAYAAGIEINAEQNTHTASVHESLTATGQKLSEHYTSVSEPKDTEAPKSIVTCFQSHQGSSSSSSSSSNESLLGKRTREENDSSSEDEQAREEPKHKRPRP
jgi:ankyrin repeat protein